MGNFIVIVNLGFRLGTVKAVTLASGWGVLPETLEATQLWWGKHPLIWA
jgi:hypothetical protein